MNNPTIGLLGLVIQSFVIFVALSTLLGRIYFLSYFHTLGIPASAVRLSVADYSILSPDTTILGIGIAVISTIALWWVRPDSIATWRYDRIVKGLVLLFVAILIGTLETIVFSTSELRAFSSGLFGILMLIPSVLSMTGGVLMVSGFPIPSGDINKSTKTRFNLRILLPILIILFVGLLLIVVSRSASIIGILDAQSTLQNAPHANVEFSSPDSLATLRHDSDICPEGSASCDFKVILIGDKFVYLSPPESDVSKSNRLYAFPVTEIANISYVLDE